MKRKKDIYAIQLAMNQAFKIINSVDLDAFIIALERDLTLAHYLDPTMVVMKGKIGKKWLIIARVFREARNKISKEFKGSPEHGG